ncbi:MAG TPA: hypothetical protein VFW71_16345 [Actinomycetota bacterium]|nr:hypothetical protein [Actinomycetota bacterium]
MIEVGLELGTKKVFAAAIDWPGWCRAGRTADLAVEALGEYVARYAPVATRAGLALPEAGFTVVEEAPGDSTTDFGAPSARRPSDLRPMSSADAARFAALLHAAWDTLDAVAATAPEELRPGPRGGGRNRDTMLGHVLGAEVVYARKLGLRVQQPALRDWGAIRAERDLLVGAIAVPHAGGPPAEKMWPPRQTARRIAWHVLDHAWEMQDRIT